MFVTHKFQHCTVLKIPNFEQKAAKFPIQAPRAMFSKESEKALARPNWLRSIDKRGNSIQSLSATYQ